MESLGRPSALLGNLFHAVPLVLEMDCLGVSIIDLVWYSIKGHDLFHKWGGDSSSKEADQDVMVHDAGTDGVTLECGDITFQREGELSILLSHVVGG